jgi:hypothetical protein
MPRSNWLIWMDWESERESQPETRLKNRTWGTLRVNSDRGREKLTYPGTRLTTEGLSRATRA